MLLRPRHLSLLEKFKEGEELNIEDLIKGGYEESEAALYDLLILELQGFIEVPNPEQPRVFRITDVGKTVVDVWNKVGKPKADPWFDSAIHAMLWTLWKTGSDIPKDWYTPLKERGFVTDSKLNEYAITLVKQFEPGVRKKKIRITRDLGFVLAKIPPTLASSEVLKRYPQEYIDLLLAMDIIVLSAPDRKYYALTRLGRYLREAIRELRPVGMEYVLVNMKIINMIKKLMTGGELSNEEKLLLTSLGYLREGRPTRAAKLLFLAIKEVEREEWWATLTVGLTRVDQWVLKVIDYLWKKAENNPELKPTKKLIYEWIERHRDEIGMDEETYKELKFSDYTIGLALHRLEALRLIDSFEEKGKLIYQLTEHGKRLLETLGSITDVPPSAVKPLVYADRGLPPFREWIEEAINFSLMGPLGAGRKARELMRIARTVKRLPLLTKLELLVLHKALPSGKSEPMDSLITKLTVLGENYDEVKAAIYWLEMWGAIEVYGNGYVELTKIGEMLKTALVAAPTGIATPVHPHFIRVLEAVEKLGTYEDLAKIVNMTRLPLDVVKDAIVLAREAKLLGRKDLTEEGKLLLEAVREIQRHVEERV